MMFCVSTTVTFLKNLKRGNIFISLWMIWLCGRKRKVVNYRGRWGGMDGVPEEFYLCVFFFFYKVYIVMDCQ